jgi:hypothetical protein
MEIAIENNLHNQYLINPFIILFRIQLANGKNKILPEIRLFGQYNFESTLIKSGTSSLVLESYFYIISHLPKHINNLASAINIPFNANKYEKLNNDYKTYQIYKTFYNNFNHIENKPESECYSLFYKPEIKITDNSYYMLRFNNAVNGNNLLAYLSSK